MATEIEIKLRVPDEKTLDAVLQDPSLTQYMRDDFTDRRFVSTYYDTEDGELSARKWTLRLRKEGDRSIAAMKTAISHGSNADMFTRNEWQCEADTIEEAIPQLIGMGAPQELKLLLKNRKLIESCGASFQRRSNILYMEDGIRLELAGDLGTLYAGDNVLPIIEVEVELLFGDGEVLGHICDQLIEDYGLTVEKLSKNARANALREAAPNA